MCNNLMFQIFNRNAPGEDACLPAQGLGFPNNSAQNVTTPFFRMVQEWQLAQNMFSVWLNPDPDADDAGEIVFGGLNPSRFTGTLTRHATEAPSYHGPLELMSPLLRMLALASPCSL